MVGPVTVSHGKVVRPSQLIRSVRRTMAGVIVTPLARVLSLRSEVRMLKVKSVALLLVGLFLAGVPAPAEHPGTGGSLNGEWLDGSVTLRFRESDLVRVLESVGRISGVAIVAEADLHYRVSFDMPDTTVRRALQLIAETQNLSYEQQGKTMHVRKRSADRAK